MVEEIRVVLGWVKFMSRRERINALVGQTFAHAFTATTTSSKNHHDHQHQIFLRGVGQILNTPTIPLKDVCDGIMGYVG